MRLNELLGIEFPFIQGGMANIATAEFAAAVSNAGALGLIGAGGMSPEVFQDSIRRCRTLTEKPFGVNIMLMHPQLEQLAAIAAQEKVAVVTTGAGDPARFIPAWKDLLIVSGLHRYLVAAIVETYNAIPVGGVKFSSTIYTDILKFVSEYFVIGFRIALPVFAVMLLVNCILAIMAKVSPQMNMFVVGIQLKLFVGLLVIYFTISMLPAVSGYILEEIETIFAALVRGMS